MNLSGKLTTLATICLFVVVASDCDFKRRTLTSDCKGQCDGYDACLPLKSDERYYPQGCKNNTEKDWYKPVHGDSGECPSSDDSGCLFQCFRLSEANSSTFDLTVVGYNANDSMIPTTPWIRDTSISSIDIRIPDHIDTLKIVYLSTSGVTSQGKVIITNETFASGKNLKSIYFDHVRFDSDSERVYNNMPDWNKVLADKDIQSFTMMDSYTGAISGGDYWSSVRTLNLSGCRYLLMPSNLNLENARTVNLSRTNKAIPQALVTAKKLETLIMTDSPAYYRNVTPELFAVLNKVNVTMGDDWTSTDFDCDDGHMETIEGTSYQVCVLDGGMSGGTIAAIVVPICVVVIAIAGFIFYRRRQKKRMQEEHYNGTMIVGNDLTEPLPNEQRA